MKTISLRVLWKAAVADWTSGDSRIVKALIGVGLVAAVALMFPRNESIEYEYEVGSVWANADLFAPFPFPLLKDARTYERERQEAVRSAYPVFEYRAGVEPAVARELSDVMNEIREAATLRSRWVNRRSPADSLLLASRLSGLPFTVTEKQLDGVAGIPGPRFERQGALLVSLAEEMYRSGVIDSGAWKAASRAVAVRKGNFEEIVPSDILHTPEEAAMAILSRLAPASGERDSVALTVHSLARLLKANMVFNAAETRRSIQAALESVPRTVGFVQENERIVGRYETITPEVKQRLDGFRKAKSDLNPEHGRWSHLVGVFFHILLILGLYSIYIYLFRKRIFHSNLMLLLIALLVGMEAFFAYLSHTVGVTVPLQYLIFLPAASMLLTIAFDSRVAFYGAVTMALLIGGIRGNDYSIALISLTAASIGAYTVRDIRNRTQIFRSIGFILLAYTLSIGALSLERFERAESVLVSLIFGLLNAVVSPVLTYGLLIFVERVFRVSTDLTLLELCDMNHPLLKELSEKAPGTFHHSVTVANLAESAAEAIGANDILAKSGALYHDVGKSAKPGYFVENQIGSNDRHRRIKPRMSVRIILDHVRTGVDLARRHGLPERVVDFIIQHHGTTRSSFFYDKAVRQAQEAGSPSERVDEDEYRYPGPKPQSREAGIVMLADLVEASTRTLTDVTPEKLGHAIDAMIKRRFVEGQLDECDLTLRDLRNIRDAFLKIVIGIHHQRISYPDQESAAPPPGFAAADEAAAPGEEPGMEAGPGAPPAGGGEGTAPA